MDLEDTVQMPAPLTADAIRPETRTDRLAAAIGALDGSRAQMAPEVAFSSDPTEPIAGSVPTIALPDDGE